jgi:hypothetical protein
MNPNTEKIIFAFFLAVALGIVLGIATATWRMARSPWEGNPPVTGGQTQVDIPSKP